MKKTKGFTLIELVMIIVILGILAVVAIPRFVDLSSDAEEAAEQGVVGGVMAGITTYFAEFRNWPNSLDDSLTVGSHATDECEGCFNSILAQGGVSGGGWLKTSEHNYTGPTGNTYTYDSADHSFRQN